MIVFPGLMPAKALGGMGIASVTIGFAFRDIFNNPVDSCRSRVEVVTAVKRSFDDAGIEIPFPYRTLTFKVSLRTHNATVEAKFVPSFSVTIAIVMSLFGLGVLIYFIHTVSESIQAQNIIANVRRDLGDAVDRIFPEKLGRQEGLLSVPIKRDYDIPTTCDREACQIIAERSGYLQAADNDALMRIAVEENLLIHLGYRPGNFITRRSVIVTVWPGEKVDEKLSRKIYRVQRDFCLD